MKNEINLDELFAKARSEEPVMSKNDVSNLITGMTKPPANFILEKLLKGDKKMLSFIGVTAAAIGILFLNVINFDNENIEIDNSNNSAKSVITANSDATVSSENVIPKPRVDEKSQTTGKNDEQNSPPQFVYNYTDDKEESKTNSKTITFKDLNSDIKGIKSLKLTAGEAKSLGINIDESGNFIEVLMSRKKPRLRKIFVDWGVGFDDSAKIIENPDNYVIPRMITDNRGMRRIEIITDDNTDISIDRIVTNDDVKNLRMLMETSGIEMDFSKNIPNLKINFDSNNPDEVRNIIKMVRGIKTELNVNSDNQIDIKKHGEDIADMMKEIFDMSNDLAKNDIFNSVKTEPDKQKLKDSIRQLITYRFDNIFPVDSSKVTIIHPDGTNSDSIIFSENISIPNTKNKKIKILKKQFSMDNGQPFNPLDSNFEVRISAPNIDIPEIDINKLLPVEIALPNAKDRNGNNLKDFSFILWLNLDEETFTLLPERLKEEVKAEFEALNRAGGAVCGFSPNDDGENYLDIWRTCAGAIENLTASPNPTDGIVNLSFLLKENRNISITVNDVFGKKVQDVVTNKLMKKGDNFESFHLKAPESGMYLVVVQTNAGEQAVHRVILNK